MKDVSKMRVAEIDALIAQATMTEEQRAEYWQEQKVAAAFCRKHPEFKPNEQSENLLDAYVKGMVCRERRPRNVRLQHRA